jgi:hypothetical protein
MTKNVVLSTRFIHSGFNYPPDFCIESLKLTDVEYYRIGMFHSSKVYSRKSLLVASVENSCMVQDRAYITPSPASRSFTSEYFASFRVASRVYYQLQQNSNNIIWVSPSMSILYSKHVNIDKAAGDSCATSVSATKIIFLEISGKERHPPHHHKIIAIS